MCNTLRDMALAYAGAPTPEELKAIVDVLLAAGNNDALFELAADDDPSVKLAVAEALLWSSEPDENEKEETFCLEGRYYPVFDTFANACGDQITTADVARCVMALVAAAPDRTKEITTVVTAYRDTYSFYNEKDEESDIYNPLFPSEEEKTEDEAADAAAEGTATTGEPAEN